MVRGGELRFRERGPVERMQSPSRKLPVVPGECAPAVAPMELPQERLQARDDRVGRGIELLQGTQSCGRQLAAGRLGTATLPFRGSALVPLLR